MDDRQLGMRASDDDRQRVVEQLRTALDTGRLKMDEYVERMERAYEAVTFGDLAALNADLPDTGDRLRAAEGTGAVQDAMPAPLTPQAPLAQAAAPGAAAAFPGSPAAGLLRYTADLPGFLRVLWSMWFTVVCINVVVWVLVGFTTASIPYPWPLWVAGPWGAALYAISSGVRAIRGRRAVSRRPS